MSLNYEKILEHYKNPLVQKEIVDFCRGRWVGFHCDEFNEHGKKILVRYFRRRKKIPIKIEKPSDLERFFYVYGRLKPRSVYATANIYGKLNSEEDVVTLSNIKACMPTWDIDNKLENWDATVQAIHEIVSVLESNGVTKSYFIKFSGRGAHVHVHPYAISEEARLKHNPLDLAWAMVEYVREKVSSKIVEVAVRFKAENLRVDNEIDPQRLFVSPLSIHKEEVKVSVCIDPNRLNCFNPETDANLDGFKHFEGWKAYVEGEADELALKAYEYFGGFPTLPKPRRRKHPPLDKQILKWLKKLESER
jgi:hypothetical protein